MHNSRKGPKNRVKYGKNVDQIKETNIGYVRT